jgi:competence protein ComEC
VAAWAAAWLVVWAGAGLGGVAAAAAVGAGLALWRRSAAAGLVAVVLAVAALVGGLRVWALENGPLADLARQGAVVEAEAVITSARLAIASPTAIVYASVREFQGRGESYAGGAEVLVFATGDAASVWAALTPGSRVAVTGRLRPAERDEAVTAILQPLTAPHLVTPASGWRAAVEHVRAALRQATAGARPEQAALLPALVVGDVSGLSAGLQTDFRTTGLTHLTAVSGANLTIFLVFLLGAARRLGVRGHWLDLVAVAGVVAFTVLCHGEPSVVRAAAMGLVGLAALGRNATAGQGLRHLCVAVIVLTWADPWLSHSIGFALSVLACVGLLVWGRPWTAALSRWLPRWAAEAVAVTAAAQLATQPLVSWLSGSVSLSGLLANVLAGPWVGPATVAGLVTALAASVFPLVGGWLGWAAAWLVEPILQIAHRCAALPGAAQPWPASPAGLIVLGAACLFLAWLIPRLFRRPWLTAALAAVLAAGLLQASGQPGWPPSDWTVTACDVGQGDALAVLAAAGQAILFDVGPPAAGLGNCLRALDVRSVPLVVLSHFHADHCGGLEELFDGWKVGALLVGERSTAAGAAAAALAETNGAEVHVASPGERFTVGAAAVEVLSPPLTGTTASGSDSEESSDENNHSLTVRVEAAGISLLAAGDLEEAGQAAVLRQGGDLAVDVLKVPHHGSARQDEAFLTASQAAAALVSVGAGNSYGHPAASTVSRLERLGMAVIRTDEHGSVSLVRRDGALVVVSQR